MTSGVFIVMQSKPPLATPCRPRRPVWAFLVTVVVMLVPTVAHAQDVGTSGQRDGRRAPAIELEDLIVQALAGNPEYRAALERVAAARQRPPQAGSLPDPMLGVVYRNVGFPELTIGDEMMAVAGIRASQALPWPGKRPLRREVAREDIDIRIAQAELVRRRLIQEMTVAVVELDLNRQSIQIVDETTRLLEEFQRTAEARYAVGEGIQQDVFKAQVETSVLINRRLQLEQERDSVITRINRIAGAPADAPVAPLRPVPAPEWELDLVQLQEEASRASAVVEERRQRQEQREDALTLARRERKPDLTVSTAWMSRGGLPDIWEINVGISLPIRKDQKQDRAVDERIEELEAAAFDRQAAADRVAEAVQDLYLRADRAARLMDLFETTIIPQATLSLESATSGYTVDKVDFLTVLDNTITLLTYQLQLAEESARYRTALARLEEHLGRSLGVSPAAVWQRGEQASPTDPVAGLAEPGGSRPGELTHGGER